MHENRPLAAGRQSQEADMDGTSSIIVSVLAVGVALASIIATMIRGLRRDLDTRIDGLDARMDGLDTRMDGLESALARLTGLLEGLGSTGRARVEPDAVPANCRQGRAPRTPSPTPPA